MIHRRPWADAELEILQKGHETWTIYEILEKLGELGGRTKSTVYGKLSRMGLRAKRLTHGSHHRRRGGCRPPVADPDPDELARRVRPFREAKRLKGDLFNFDRTPHKIYLPGRTDD